MWFLSEKFTPVLIHKLGQGLLKFKSPVFGKRKFFFTKSALSAANNLVAY